MVDTNKLCGELSCLFGLNLLPMNSQDFNMNDSNAFHYHLLYYKGAQQIRNILSKGGTSFD